MSNFLKIQSKKLLITILAVITILMLIPKNEIAVEVITAEPIATGSTRTMGELLRREIVAGKKLKFTVASNIKMVGYSWNRNLKGTDSAIQSTSVKWLNVTNRTVEIPIDVYNNGKDVPTGLLELNVVPWDGVEAVPVMLHRIYYVVDELTVESNQDKTPPKIDKVNFSLPEDNENNPIKVKAGDTSRTFKFSIEDIGNSETIANSTGVYACKGEIVNNVGKDYFTNNAKVWYNKKELTVGYGNSVDIQLPETLGTCYIQMYAIDGSNNSSGIYWVKFEIKNDIEAPEIIINKGANGLEEQFVEINTDYQDPGAIARDNNDGEFTATADISKVNTKAVGEYKVTYTAKDTAGNEAEAKTRIVYVVNHKPLIDKIAEAKQINPNDYTEESYKNLTDKISELEEKILENKSSQPQIEEQIKNLQDIIDTLVIQSPEISNVEITTQKTANADGKHYLKVDKTNPESITVTFNTGKTEVNTLESIIINGRELTSAELAKIKLEKLEGFNYKFTYQFVEADKETTNGLVSVQFSVRKEVSINNQTADASTNMTGANIIFDKTNPVISFNSDAVIADEMYINEEYVDTAPENITVIETNTTGEVISDLEEVLKIGNAGTYTITYKVVDKAGNESNSITKTIKVKDYIKKVTVIDNPAGEYEFGETLSFENEKFLNTKIQVEMASNTTNTEIAKIKTLADLIVYLKNDLKITENEVKAMLSVAPNTALDKVTDRQEVVVTSNAYGTLNGANRMTIENFTIKVTKASIPDMPKPEDIEIKPGQNPEGEEDKDIVKDPSIEPDLDKDLERYTVTYDGKPHKLEVDAETKAKMDTLGVTVKYTYKLIKDSEGKSVENGELIENIGATNAGTYEVTAVFTAPENYKDPETKKAILKINKADQTKPTITLSENEAILGETAPTITVTGDPKEMDKKDAVYSSTNENVAKVVKDENGNPILTIIGAGTADITVKYEKTANYKESISEAVKITVKQNPTTDDLNIVLPQNPEEGTTNEYKYDGTDKIVTYTKPEGMGNVTIEYYKDNETEPKTSARDAGTYTVKAVIADGDKYKGKTIEVGTIKIVPRVLTINAVNKESIYEEVIEDPSNYLNKEIQGDSILPNDGITVSLRSEVLENLDENKKVTSNVSGSPYTIEIVVTGENNNYRITKNNGTHTVIAKTITNKDVNITAPANSAYKDGAPKEVTVQPAADDANISHVVKYYKKAENAGENDLEVTIPEEVGTYYAVVTFTGKNNYIGTLTITSSEYKIEKAEGTLDPNYKVPENLTAIYGETLADVKLPEGFKYQDATTTSVGPANANGNTFKVTYTPANPNYAEVTNIEVKIVVTPKVINLDDIQITLSTNPDENGKIEYTGNPITATATLPEGITEIVPIITYVDKDGNPITTEKPVNAGEYVVKVTLPNNPNYQVPDEAKTLTFEITKKELKDANMSVTVNVPENRDYKKGTISEVTANIDTKIAQISKIEYYKKDENEPTGFKSIGTQAPENAGTYKAVITITAKPDGNYKGELDPIWTEEFTIRKLTQDIPNVGIKQNNTPLTLNNGKYNIEYTNIEGLELTLDNVPKENGKITYSYSEEGIASVVENRKIVISKAGTVTITVTFEETTNYQANTKDIILEIGKGSQPLPELSLSPNEIIFTETEGPELTIRNEADIKGNVTPVVTIDEAHREDIEIQEIDGIRKVVLKENKTFKPGKITITVTYPGTDNYLENTNTIDLIVKKGTLNKDDFILSNNNYEYEEGKIRKVTVTPEALGVTANDIIEIKYYKVNKNSDGTVLGIDENETINPENAGEYRVRIKLKETANYEAVEEPLEIGTLLISKALYRLPINVRFDNKTVDYIEGENKQGVEQEITISNKPEGIEVNYLDADGNTTNKGTNAGTYNAVATLSLGTALSENYSKIVDQNDNDIIPMTATLTIRPIAYKLPNTIKFVVDDKDTLEAVNFNREEHKIELVGMPEGITAKYENNKGTNAGTYNAVATFELANNLKTNYSSVEPATMNGILTINKIDPTRRDFIIKEGEQYVTSKTFTYDGNPKTVDIVSKYDGQEIDGMGKITVRQYDINGQRVDQAIEVGTYIVRIAVEEGKNYKSRSNFAIDATIIIEKNTPVISDIDKTKLLELKAVKGQTLETIKTQLAEINTTTPEGTFTFDADEKTTLNTVGEIMNYTVTFTPKDTKNYNIVQNIPTKITVEDVKLDRIEANVKKGAIFYIGNTIDKNNIEVIGINNDGSILEPAIGTNYEITPSIVGTPEEGKNTIDVTITYQGKSVTIQIPCTQKGSLAKANFEVTENEYDYAPDTIRKAKVVSKVPGITEKDITIKYYNQKGEIVENPINAGIYTIKIDVAKTETEYAEIKDLEVGTLTIKQIVYTLANNVVFNGTTVDYDGNEHEITVSNLPVGITARYENNKGTNAGTYNAKASFELSEELQVNYSTVSPTEMNATLTINKIAYALPNNVVFNGTTVDYDGDEHEITVSNLPVGITARYENNKGTNAGTYNAKATFELSEELQVNYNAVSPTEMNATLTINKIAYTLPDNVVFNGTTVNYDGNEHEITVSNLPVGITARYENNKGTNAGTYNAKATFELSEELQVNYNAVSPTEMNATLTINKIAYALPNNVVFNGTTVDYDGDEHEITVSNLPVGITARYENNKGTNAGTYNAKATFELSEELQVNYNAVSPTEMNATLTINKVAYKLPENVKFENAAVDYDGDEHEITVSNLPEGITARYENNKGTNAGTYNAKATFELSEELQANYNAVSPTEMNATLTINKAAYKLPENVKFENATVDYDGDEHEITVSNLPVGITAKYENNKGTNAGTYNAKAIFELSEELQANYNAVSPIEMNATLTINKIAYELPENVKFENATVDYDGDEHEITVSNLPVGITAKYENNKGTNAGTYNAKATFELSEELQANYDAVSPTEMNATLTINKVAYKLPETTKFEGKTVTYDGKVHSLVAVGLPTGITAKYSENNGQTNAGTYEITATFELSKELQTNYNSVIPNEKKATLQIDKATYNMSEITFNDATVIYDGEGHTLYITGKLPDGVTVNYYTPNDTHIDGVNNKGYVNAGTYKIIAKFEGDKNNYNDIPNMEAQITIEKAEYELLENVTFEDAKIEYDGEEHEITVSNLPEGVSVEYENNKGTNAGTYNAKATFILSEELQKNYKAVKPSTMNATLTIDKATYNLPNTVKLVVDDKETIEQVMYDGKEHQITAVGVPEGIKVDYITNKGTDVGEYDAIAVFSLKDELKGNYKDVDPAQLEATLKIIQAPYILPDNVKFDDKTVYYNGEEQSVVVEGLISGITPVYTNNTGIDANTYEAEVTFTLTDEQLAKNYSHVETKTGETKLTATLTINKRPITVTVSNNGAESIYESEPEPENWDYVITPKTVIIGEEEVTLEPAVIEKDGSIIELSIIEILAGGSERVIYQKDVNTNIDTVSKEEAGNYTLKAICTNSNYEADITNAVYKILPRDPKVEDLNITEPTSYEYNNESKVITVAPEMNEKEPVLKGLTQDLISEVMYYEVTSDEGNQEILTKLDEAPKNVGNYVAKVQITAGRNHNAKEIEIARFSITPKTLQSEDITYTIDDTQIIKIEEGIPETTNIPVTWDGTQKIIEWNGMPHGVVANLNTTNPVIAGNTVTFKVLYNGMPNIPSEIGEYVVTVSAEGENLNIPETAQLEVGTFEIKDRIAPFIKLKGTGGQGEDAKTVYVGEGAYSDEGVDIIDNHDNLENITKTIKIEKLTPGEASGKVEVPSIDTSPTGTGTYIITYGAVDASGNAAVDVIRTVVVKKHSQPTPITDLSLEDINNFIITSKGFTVSLKNANEIKDGGKITYTVNPLNSEDGVVEIPNEENGRVNFLKSGNAKITVTFGETDYYDLSTIDIPIKVNKAKLAEENFTVRPNDYTYEKDVRRTVEVVPFENDSELASHVGLYRVVLQNQNTEKDNTIYENTAAAGPINAGTYDIYVIKETSADSDWFETTIVKDAEGNISSDKIKIGTMTIKKARYDMSGVSLGINGKIETIYTGEAQPVNITGTLPEGVSCKITYSDEPVNAGTYQVTAEFTGNTDNYEPIANMKAEYKILPKPYSMETDIAGIRLTNNGQYKLTNDWVTFEVDTNTLAPGLAVDGYAEHGEKKTTSYKEGEPGTYQVDIYLKVTDPNRRLPDELLNRDGTAKPITRTAKIAKEVTAPQISYIRDNNTGIGKEITTGNIAKPTVFSKLTVIQWDSGSAVITKVNANDEQLEAPKTYAKPEKVTLSQDGYYRITATLEPQEGETQGKKTTRYIRIARKSPDVSGVITGTEIDTDYYEADNGIVTVKLTGFENVTKVSLDMFINNSRTPETVEGICEGDGQGNMTVVMPNGTRYSVTKSGNDIVLTFKLAEGVNSMSVDIKSRLIASETNADGSLEIKTIDIDR